MTESLTVGTSSFQRRVWLADRLEPGRATYNVPMAWRVDPPVNPEALGRALAAVVAEHEILRTRFAEIDGEVHQVIEAPWQPRLARLTVGADPADLDRVLLEQTELPFDPQHGELLRCGLIDVDGGGQVLFLVAHHLIWDAASEPVFLAALARGYRAALASGSAVHYPATAHQERMAFVDRFENGELYPSGPVYHNLPLRVALPSAMDVDQVATRLAAAVARHEALRTTLTIVDGEVRQQIRPDTTIAVDTIEPGAAAYAEWAARPFDLAAGPLIRVGRQAEPDQAWLTLAGHLAVVDRASLLLLARELVHGEAPPTRSFAEAVADREVARVKADIEALAERMRGEPAPLKLPESRTRAAVHLYREESVPLAFSAQTAAGELDPAALLAGFAAVLSWYTGQDDLVIGTVQDCRDDENATTIGPVANLVPVRLRLASHDTGADLVRACAHELAVAGRHRKAPFDDLVSRLNPAKDMARMALFDVLFQCVDAVDGIEETGSGYGKYDLHLFLRRDGGRLHGAIVYNGLYFDRALVAQLADHYVRMMRLISDSPQLPVNELEPLRAQERQQQLQLWNATDADFADVSLPQLIRSAAARRPDALALTAPTEQVPYGRLMQRVEAMARGLAASGVQPGELVALRLPRGVAQVEAVLAVLFAGAAYLPVDVGVPAERLAFMLTDSGTRWLISDDEPTPPGVTTLSLSKLAAGAEAELPEVEPSAPAYCIYTSGTTGRPKGVVISHRNVVRLLGNDRFGFSFGDDDVWTLFHSYSFDFAVWELFGCLAYGGRLVIVPGDVARDPQSFVELARRERVTVLNQTPGAFSQLVEALGERGEPLSDLRYVIFGGQRLQPRGLAGFAARHPRTRLVNMYGITETTVHVTIHTVTADDIAANRSTIGQPIPTTTVYLLDPRHGRRLVPPSAVGEICVGGLGVADGYLNRPELTEERFAANPYGPGRLFRSGDLARYRPDGTMEYVGRGDNQVKIRGYRIELGEVEACLLEHPDVAEAVVALDVEGTERLAAYVRLRAPVATAHLRAHLARLLPGHMIPATISAVARVPLTRNGKVDLPALRATVAQHTVPDGRAQSPTARRLAAIWREVLQIEQIGPGDSFFESGGHSMLATRLVAQISQRLGVALPLRDVFEFPRLGDLAERIDERLGTPGPAAGAEPGPDETVVAASPFQERLWLAEHLHPDSAQYTVPLMWRVAGRLDPARLAQALAGIVARHEILRTRFADHRGRLRQIVGPGWSPEVEYEDLRSLELTEPDRLARIEQRLRREHGYRFDPGSGRLLKAILLDLGPDDQVLFLCSHHLVCDGQTMQLLVKELAARYADPGVQREKALQYRDFVVAQERLGAGAAGLEFWRERLAGAVAVAGLPVVGSVQPHGAVVVPLAGDVLARLRGLLAGQRVSWFMVVASAVAVMLHRWSGSPDVTFGCPIGNRDGFDEVVGPCLNTVVLRSRCEPGATVGDVLAQMRSTVLDAMEFQHVPFESVVEALNPPRVPGWTPYIDVTLAPTARSFRPPTLGPSELTALRVDPAGTSALAKFALVIEFVETPDGLAATMCHRGDRYAADLVAGMAGWLGRLIDDFDRLQDRPLAELSWPGVADPPPVNATHVTEAAPVEESTRRELSEVEQRVAGIWSAVLGVDDVGPEDRFFDLGGTSLRLVVLHSRLCRELGVDLELTDLFDAPTVRAMARAVQAPNTAEGGEDARSRAAAARRSRAARRPGTP